MPTEPNKESKALAGCLKVCFAEHTSVPAMRAKILWQILCVYIPSWAAKLVTGDPTMTWAQLCKAGAKFWTTWEQIPDNLHTRADFRMEVRSDGRLRYKTSGTVPAAPTYHIPALQMLLPPDLMLDETQVSQILKRFETEVAEFRNNYMVGASSSKPFSQLSEVMEEVSSFVTQNTAYGPHIAQILHILHSLQLPINPARLKRFWWFCHTFLALPIRNTDMYTSKEKADNSDLLRKFIKHVYACYDMSGLLLGQEDSQATATTATELPNTAAGKGTTIRDTQTIALPTELVSTFTVIPDGKELLLKCWPLLLDTMASEQNTLMQQMKLATFLATMKTIYGGRTNPRWSAICTAMAEAVMQSIAKSPKNAPITVGYLIRKYHWLSDIGQLITEHPHFAQPRHFAIITSLHFITTTIYSHGGLERVLMLKLLFWAYIATNMVASDDPAFGIYQSKLPPKLALYITNILHLLKT